MGCLLAAYLEAVTEVVMVGRWPAQLAALQAQGLTLRHPDGRITHHAVRAAIDPTAAQGAAAALVLVKSGRTAQAARDAARCLAPDGLALTLQNGLGNLEQLTAVLGPRRAALGSTSQGAMLVAPGDARHAGHGPTYLARTPETAERLANLAALFQQAGLETHLVDDAAGLVWGKLAVNAAINPLTALLRVPNGFLAGHDGARALMGQAAAEVAAVAQAQGIALPYPDAAARALAVAQATAANHSSMLQDVLRGAPTEIEAICGAVVDYGARLGVPTPLNRALLALVRRAEQGDWRLEPGDVAGLEAALAAAGAA